MNHSGMGEGGVMRPPDGGGARWEMADCGSSGKKGWSGDGWLTGGVASVLRMGFALRTNGAMFVI